MSQKTIEVIESRISEMKLACRQHGQTGALFAAIARSDDSVDRIGIAEAGESLTALWMNETHVLIERLRKDLSILKGEASQAS
jgi:hypothetical protein